MVKNHDPMTNRTRGLIPLPSGDVPEGTQCIMICIPSGEQYKRQLMGGLYEFTHWNAYERDATHKATSVAQAWRKAIMEGMLNCYQFRNNGGVQQYSTDGGETWTNMPSVNDGDTGYDVRNDEPLLPARAGDNKPCLAAANAVACLVELHREIVDWYNNVGIALVLLGALALILGVFFPVSWAVAGLSLSAVTMSVYFATHSFVMNLAAFTTAIQEKLICILHCNADVNGQWDETAFTDILAQIALESGEMWEVIHYYINDIAGIRGLNNAGTTTSVATYNCATCYCSECPPTIEIGEAHVLYPKWNSPVAVNDGITATLTGTYYVKYASGYAALRTTDYARVTFSSPVCCVGIGQVFARFCASSCNVRIHDVEGNDHYFSSTLPGTPTNGTAGPYTEIITPGVATVETEYVEITGSCDYLLVDGIRVLYVPKIT